MERMIRVLLFFIFSSILFLKHHASAAAVAHNYVVKAHVYVDHSGFQKWTAATGKTQADLRHEMDVTFGEISQIMKSLEAYHLHMQIQVEKLTVLSSNILPVDSDNKVVTNIAAESFKTWVSPKYSSHHYDIAVLWTGHNLVSSHNNHDDHSLGYAYIGVPCKPNGVGVVEISGTYTDVLIAAHEIGHILGCDHDGSGDASACPSGLGYVMESSINSSTTNHFKYSACSAHSMKSVINHMNANHQNCFNDGTTTAASRFGSLMTADDLCKRKYGSTSYVARKAHHSYGDDVCVKLYCMTKTEGHRFYWNSTPSPPGLDCGVNKQCDQGKCVAAPHGNSAPSDVCPFGDQPKIEGDYDTTCSKIPAASCDNWKYTCCETCNIADPGKGLTADAVCKQLRGPDSSMARRAYSHGYGDLLCSKLACISKVEGHSFSWHYYTAPNGMNCGKGKSCDNGKCVHSSFGDPNMSDACPYGDQPYLAGSYQTTCSQITSQHGCSSWKVVCCGSCPA